MQCHSTSVKSHQLKLSVSPITTLIVEEITDRCCLIDLCVPCLTEQKKNSNKNIKHFRSNDIGTYVATLKIGTNNVVIGDMRNS